MEHSLVFTILTTLGTFVFSVGGAWIRLKGVESKIGEIDKKFNEMVNEYMQIKTSFKKDIETLKLKTNKAFVLEEECDKRCNKVVKQTEFDLIMQKIEMRFLHMETTFKEIKKDIKEILQRLA